MVALDYPPARGGIQTYLAELARRLDAHVIAPDAPGPRGWSAVPSLLARAARALAGGGFAGVLLGHAKLAAGVPLLRAAGVDRTVVFTYGMEVTAGRFKPLERFGLRRAWRVVTISAYTAGHLERLGVSPARIRRVPPGVTVPADAPSRADGATLLTVGRIELSEGYKGHDRVLAALPALIPQFPALKWVVAGAGSGLPALARAVAQAGLQDRVRLAGEVSAEELARLYAEADVFVLPSTVAGERDQERFEGFGIVYLEAAAHGCPVVATRAGGTPDAVADGETGLLVDPARPDALAEALARLLGDAALRRRLGDAGRVRARDAFTWEHAAAKLAAVLEEAP
jgi:phosphatidylinositol alpha-1,6-mannosyltransferase